MAYNNGQDEAREYVQQAGKLVFSALGSLFRHLAGKTSADEYRYENYVAREEAQGYLNKYRSHESEAYEEARNMSDAELARAARSALEKHEIGKAAGYVKENRRRKNS